MARVMPIMSQGQHLKLNKNTEDKIALFHCRFGEWYAPRQEDNKK